tara:strand:- start:562 stop:870 length:309 start_codon:yes stop_codon:yes gene_type:complete
MLIYVDIDETICDYDGVREYPLAKPIPERIDKMNSLYDEGHTIVYWTARGSVSGIDWRETTERQFAEWGVKYHDLKLMKPAYDIFICDKAVNSEDYFKDEKD